MPIEVAAFSVTVPLLAMMSRSVSPPSRIAPCVETMSTAAPVAFVVCTLPSVTLPIPLMSMVPLPALITAPSA